MKKKLLSTAPAHGHARPPNAKPVRRGRTQRNRNLLDHHRKIILTARRQSATEISTLFHEQKVVDYLHRENHSQLPAFRTRRRWILQSRRTESGEKKKEKKTAKSDRANDVADAKNDENRQKTAEEKTENSSEKQANTLNTNTDKETSREVFKENIKDITTSAIKRKKLLPLMMSISIPYVPGRKWWTDWP